LALFTEQQLTGHVLPSRYQRSTNTHQWLVIGYHVVNCHFHSQEFVTLIKLPVKTDIITLTKITS